jgi:UDP-N-acetylglucosamine transferase subunit ALG13
LEGFFDVGVEPTKPLVFLTVGTDHHRFDRVVHWFDAWLEGGAADRVRSLVQHGASVPSAHAPSRDFLTYEQMDEAIQEAAVIISHAGPGTIMLAAEAGKVPIVVPRVHALREHVDDHQVLFAQRLREERTIVLADSESKFRQFADRALANPFARPQRASSTDDAVRRFEEVVDELMGVSRVTA